MTTVRPILLSLLCFTPFVSARAFASPAQDQHVVSRQQLAAAVESHVANQDADRAAIHDALKRDDVQRAAASMHVDLGRAHAVVDTMSGADLAQAASLARQIDADLVGGASTITISTTTIIIVLLLIILIVLIAK